MPVTYLLTCEHAGNKIPAAYSHLFEGKEDALFTHKAIDFGALHLARTLAAALKWPLITTSVSRLLVEANRSLDNPELFSEFSHPLPAPEKETLLDTCYFPHRNEVERQVGLALAAGREVVHLAIHTFTPVLEGEVRPADIGILFDPGRPGEKKLAARLKKALQKENPAWHVLYNSPYPGTDDGLPTHLRKLFGPENYAGFELEVNQKFFLSSEPARWAETLTGVSAAFRQLAGN